MTSQAFLAKVLKAKSQQVMVIAIIVVLSAIVYLRLDLHANSGKKKKVDSKSLCSFMVFTHVMLYW